MGTHNPERRSRTLSSATWLRAPFAPPFSVTAIKRGEGAGSSVFAVPVLMGCGVGRRRAWGLEEKGQRLFLHAGGGFWSCFYDGEEGGIGLGLGLAREVWGMVKRLRDVGENWTRCVRGSECMEPRRGMKTLKEVLSTSSDRRQADSSRQ